MVAVAAVAAVAGVVSLFFRMKSDSKAKNAKSRVVVVAGAVVLAVVIVVAMVVAVVVWTVAVAIAVMAVVMVEKEVAAAADTFWALVETIGEGK